MSVTTQRIANDLVAGAIKCLLDWQQYAGLHRIEIACSKLSHVIQLLKDE